MSDKPKVNSAGQKELDRVEKQFEAFHEDVKAMTLDRMNEVPKAESDPQTKLSQKEIDKSKDIYLKPVRTMSCKEKFNETYRKDWEFASEYVQFIAENKEIIGEKIEIWTKPFAGIPAEYWEIPPNKPVWGPRHLAEQIKKAAYHRLRTEEKTISSDGMGSYYGAMVIDSLVQRLDAVPVSSRKSVFMNASGF